MEAAGAELFFCPSPELYAVVTPSAVELGQFRALPAVQLEGELARGLGEDVRAGRLSSANAARLRSLGAALGADLDAVLGALAAGALRPATAADLVRRGGWGVLWIELVASCGLACAHCYAEAGAGREDRLDLVTILDLLEDAAALGFRKVQLTGGDPLLSPHLLPAVDAARGWGLTVEIFTNGLLLAPPLLAALGARAVRFAFSLYGDEPAVHDAITGVAGSFERTVDAIRRTRAEGLGLRVAVAAMRQNAPRIPATLRLARELTGDAGAVEVDVVRGVGRGRFDAGVVLPAEACEGGSRDRDPERSRRKEGGRACVAASGDVFPCIFMRWVTLGRVGRDGRLREILAAPRVSPGWVLAPEAELAAAAAERLTCSDCQRAARLLA
ncbi:MAG TPA: radical SAM protein, partial [Polyangiaceae bacterium]|nr:radical SAM protein [Polyangiaceae bacterium]